MQKIHFESRIPQILPTSKREHRSNKYSICTNTLQRWWWKNGRV